ncbi:MAG: efflux RND transporter permease subunit [Thermoguttaceae bacterium]
MNFIQFSINNPVKVIVGVLIVLLFGLIALTAVPIQLTPDVDRPLISIRTVWPGRSPEEVETSIIIEQEKKLKTLQGLYKMTSIATLGSAEIQLEFNVGYNMARAVQESSNRLNEVPNYPEDVERPVIRAASSQSDEAIGYLMIESGDPDYNIAEFYDYADRYLKPALERIKNVAQVDIFGGLEHEVQVRYDPVVLAQSGISVDQLRTAIRGDNLNDSAGDLADGRLDMRFRVIGRYNSLEPIRNTILKYVDGIPIYVKDVAQVSLVLKKNTGYVQSRGKPAMSLFIRREVGANVREAMQSVREALKEIQGEGGLIRQYKNDRYKIRLRLVSDDSTYIDSAIGIVWSNMILGGSLAVLVLLAFLRSTRPTLIIALAIPISVIGTFIVMYVAGRNINVISLAGLSFAIGMVVDNAIVVLENIDRHLHMGKSPGQAAYDGTREVWGAVLSSTLTTVAVFAPVLTIQEESGQLFYDIALAICASVLLSLIVAVTVIPMSCAAILREVKPQHSLGTRILKSCFGLLPVFSWMSGSFARLIYLLTERSISGILVRILLVGTISIGALILSFAMMPPASYLPIGNKNQVTGTMIVPPGYSYNQFVSIGRRVQEQLRPYWEAETTEESSGIQTIIDPRTQQPSEPIPPIKDFFLVLRPGRIFMLCTSKDPLRARPLEALLNKTMNSVPGSIGNGSQRSIFGRRAGGSNSVQIEVTGNDQTRLRDSSSYLENRLASIFSRPAVQSDPSNYILNGPELELHIDQVRAKELGIGVNQLATIARSMIDGTTAGDFDFEGDNIDLTIIRDPDIPMSPGDFENLPIVVVDSDGKQAIIPISQLIRFVHSESSQQIRRVEQERAIQLTVNPPQTVALEEAQAQILQAVEECRKEGGITPDIRINLAGNADKLSQTRAAMMGQWKGLNWDSLQSVGLSRFFLSLIITYLLMSALFESFLYPLVIMFSVPFALFGGIMGLSFVSFLDPTQKMDTLTMLGCVILIGVVVNNAILVVHQALNFMRGVGESEEDKIEALGYREAIQESVRTRLRPIFMTTATSVIGMLPLVIAPGAGSELYRGLGAVVVGGLTCSTLFTLIIVPLMFCLSLDFQAGLAFFKKVGGRRVESSEL